MIHTKDALRHDWSAAQERCTSCGLTSEECYRMGAKPSDVYCKARLPEKQAWASYHRTDT